MVMRMIIITDFHSKAKIRLPGAVLIFNEDLSTQELFEP